MDAALLLVSAIAGAAALLGAALVRHGANASAPTLEAELDALLPQTQCGQCGHPGCRPYARAMAAGEPANRCPPGGQATADALAHLLGRPALSLDAEPTPATLAVIREEECIGCTKCIQACPVDAIVGAAKYTHTVIASACTGCDLCIEPCPVDCIDLVPVPDSQAMTQRTATRSQPAAERACIRCGDCAEACPEGLLPQQLFAALGAADLDAAAAYRLDACLSCGECDRVCPSELPLSARLRTGRQALGLQRAERQAADLARSRFQAHEQRVAADQQRRSGERAARLQRLRARASRPARTPAARAQLGAVRDDLNDLLTDLQAPAAVREPAAAAPIGPADADTAASTADARLEAARAALAAAGSGNPAKQAALRAAVAQLEAAARRAREPGDDAS